MSELTRVLLLYGGRSAEHDVSRVSAASVARALEPARYDVIPVGITTDGQWCLDDELRIRIRKGGDAIPAALPVTGEPVALVGDPTHAGLMALHTPTQTRLAIDVVFPLLHGPYGEDGTIQGLLELAGLPYVGSGVTGSAVAMDKIMMKRALGAAGLPLTPYEVVRESQWDSARGDAIAERLGLPCFVKPANMGSSIGVSKARTRTTLDVAVDDALRFDEWVVCETAVTGREIEVAVLGDLDPIASVPGEIIPGDEFYTYNDKYEDDRAQLLAPAPLNADEVAAVQALAVRAFQAVQADGLARIDFFYDATPGGAGFVLNEVNTMPGFTPISMFPKLWECSGVAYPELCDRLIGFALDRHRRRSARAGRQRSH